MSDDNSTSSSGIGLGTVVFLIFMVLKLTGYITWSWWWVTAPLWGPVLVALTVFGGVLLVAGIALLIGYFATKE